MSNDISGSITFLSSSFDANIASGVKGGAVCISSGTLLCLNSTFTNNTAFAGGALYADGTRLTGSGLVFSDNQAQSKGAQFSGAGLLSVDFSNSTFYMSSVVYVCI
jgi:predicted outer membrane repeat protein